MGIADFLFGWTAGSPERQDRERQAAASRLASEDAQRRLLEYQMDEAKFKLGQMKKVEEFKTTYGLDPAMPTEAVGRLATLIAQQSFSSPGPVQPTSRMSQIMTDPEASAFAMYGQDPFEAESKSAAAELNRAKAKETTATAGLFERIGGTPSLNAFTTGGNTAPAMFGDPLAIGLMKKAGVEVPAPSWRSDVPGPDGQFGQAAFSGGQMIPGTWMPGKIDAAVQMVRQGDGSMRAVNVGGPNSPFPGREIAVENGKIVDKGEVKGAPELVQRSVQLADGSEISVFVPVGGTGIQTKPPASKMTVAASGKQYVMPDGTQANPNMTVEQVTAAGGKPKEEMSKEKATTISAAKIAMGDIDQVEAALTNPDGSINKTELFKMFPLGNVSHISIPGTSGVPTAARWTNALESIIRDESGAAISSGEMGRLYARFPLSYTMGDADIKDTFARVRNVLNTKVRTIDPAKATEWEKANALKGTKDGKQVLVVVDDGKKASKVPTAENFKGLPEGKILTDKATGAGYGLINGQVVRVK